jgi:hypothetical protein
MLKRFTIAALLLISLSGVAGAACASGFIQITDPFLNPNATPWSGSIVYTLAYNTTVAGTTIVGSRQQFNVTNGINICLAPGLYSPVSLQQGGFSFSITNSWGVPTSGGPYTIAQIQGNITLQAPGLLSNSITVTNAQMLALNATAITLVPSPGPNIVIVPEYIFSEQINAWYSSEDQLLQVGFGSSIASFHGAGSFGMLSGMGGTYLDSYYFPGVINGQSSVYVGMPFIGYADDAVTQPSGTGGNVYITTWYRTVTIQ